jgi:hypothetical protein
VNNNQRTVLVVGLIVAALMALAPPWVSTTTGRLVEYRPFFINGHGVISLTYLLLQIVALALATGAAYFLCAARRD